MSEFAPDTIEKIAYKSVSGIPTEEPNDRFRLGYHVWRWLVEKQGTLSGAVSESAARLHVSVAEATKQIETSLREQGITW